MKGFRKPGDMEDGSEVQREQQEKVFPPVANGSGPIKDSHAVEYLVNPVSDQVTLRDNSKGTRTRPMSEVSAYENLIFY